VGCDRDSHRVVCGDPAVSETFTCAIHGEIFPVLSEREAEEKGLLAGCVECTGNIAMRPPPSSMTGAERKKEVLDLLSRPLTVAFSLVWHRIDALVGRSTWNHEMAEPERLAQEAETWKHPSDLNAHALHTLEQLAGEKPVIIVDTEKP
jgi:hypothetical protein